MPVAKKYPAPAYDRELGDFLTTRGVPSTMVLEQMIEGRSRVAVPSIDEVVAERNLEREDRTITSLDGDYEIAVSIFKKSTYTSGGPGVFYVHGGGMVGGDRFTGVDRAFEWIDLFDAVVVSAEYRLAPEHPDPAPVNDCYAGLAWTMANAKELNFDENRIIIVGGSSGGGLAAGATLMARDRGDAPLTAQILIGPMLDDRNETFSSHQIDGIGVWDRESNLIGWDALLGRRRGTDDVSIYAVPARATDLSGLPPTYIDCGSVEVFRDEDIAYANAIWAAGGTAELHVWSGGHHGFDTIFPTATLSLLARRTRADFVGRVLGLS